MKRKLGLLAGVFMLAMMAACGKEETIKEDDTGGASTTRCAANSDRTS